MPQTAEGQQVDSAVQQTEGEPQGGSRMYTQDELNSAVDRAVKARIDKQNSKHSREMTAKDDELASVNARLAELTESFDAYKAEGERVALVDSVSKETGVDAELLARMVGDDEDAIRANAELLKSKVEAIPKNPVVVDSGAGPAPTLTAEQVSGIKDPVARVHARAANKGLYR